LRIFRFSFKRHNGANPFAWCNWTPCVAEPLRVELEHFPITLFVFCFFCFQEST